MTTPPTPPGPAAAAPGTRTLLLALAVLGGAVLVVVGLLLGAALGGSSAAAVPVEESVDAGFARDMQVHHGQGVEMSVMVRDRSEDPEVRGIALDIMLTQQNQQGQMAGWLQTWGLRQSSTLPVMGWMSTFPDGGMSGMAGMAGMAGMHETGMAEDTGTAPTSAENPMVTMGLATRDELAALAAAEGVEAERRFLQLMIDHHRGGVEMAAVAAEEAGQPQVRRLAASMVTGQTAELDRLQQLLDARGGPLAG